MKQDVYEYVMWFHGDRISENAIYLNQSQAQKIIILLTGNNCPRFILVKDNLIAVSSIRKIKKNKDSKVLRELSETEEKINKMYLELTNQNKLLE